MQTATPAQSVTKPLPDPGHTDPALVVMLGWMLYGVAMGFLLGWAVFG